MRLPPFLLLLASIVITANASTPSQILRFAPHEIAFSATGTYANPYVELAAEATLARPDGRTAWTLPLFWDGGSTWDIVMAGGYVVAGFGSTYMGGHRHPTAFLPDDPKNTIWVEQIGHVKELFSRLPYWQLDPHDELLASPDTRSPDRVTRTTIGDRATTLIRAPATTYWCLAEPGRNYLVYVRGTQAPLTLAVAARSAWNVLRCDPRTGATASTLVTAEGAHLRLQVPDEQDWVFAIQPGSR